MTRDGLTPHPNHQPREPMNDLPNVSDPDIRAMVLSNHRPEESWSMAGDVKVQCQACWRSWPCPSIKAARAAESELPHGESEWAGKSEKVKTVPPWRRRSR